MKRRCLLRKTGPLVVALACPALAAATAVQRVTLSVPGPGNLLYLPLTLVRCIGADRAEGLDMGISYVGGGPQALRTMLERNTDFAAAGLSALALQKSSGKPVACIVPLTRVP